MADEALHGPSGGVTKSADGVAFDLGGKLLRCQKGEGLKAVKGEVTDEALHGPSSSHRVDGRSEG